MASDHPDTDQPAGPAPAYAYLRHWEAALAQFRTACRSANPPTVAQLRDYLAPFPSDQQPDMLVNLVAEHLQLSWEAGRGRLLSAYGTEFGADFPDEFASPAVVPADLVESEFLARYALPGGDCPALDEYRQRFPERPDVLEPLQARHLDGDRYVKIRSQGSGGMGRVWLAYDRHLARHVAVKEPKPDLAGNDQVLRRLGNEARLTAGIEHPAIITVHELKQAGTDPPFYVMRLVHGRTLREVIQEYHQSPAQKGSGPQRLLWNRLLQAFVTVCDALAYAHQRRVLHRDLKPANVVLGEFGETVVLDWGLGKRLEAPLATPPAAVPAREVAEPAGKAVETPPELAVDGTPPSAPAGTLAYMAPEQLQGIADQRSDVFGLGAILYEILTGQAPYELPTADEPTAALRLRVKEGKYDLPRRLQSQVPRALEAVCLKALACHPADRYNSAAELGQDVRRYLANEPVRAWREPLGARIWRWIGRHQKVVSSAVAAVLVAAIGLSGATVLLMMGAQRERTAKERAEKTLKLSLASVEEYLTGLSNDRQLKAYGLEGLRKEWLAQAKEHLDRLLHELGDDPNLQAERGLAYLRLSVITDETGSYQEALQLCQQAYAIFRQLNHDHPGESDYQARLANSLFNLGWMYQEKGETDQARTDYEQALAIFERLTQPPSNDPKYKHFVAKTLDRLGQVYEIAAQRDQALGAAEKSVSIWKQLAHQDPNNATYQEGLCTALNTLGTLYQHVKQMDRAKEAHEESLAVSKELARIDPRRPDYQDYQARALGNLGSWYHINNQPEQAKTSFELVLCIHEQLAKDHPRVPEYRHLQAKSLWGLGLLAGQTGEAKAYYDQGIALGEELVHDYPDVLAYRNELAYMFNALGSWYYTNGQQGPAGDAFRRALELMADNALAHFNLGRVLTDENRPTEAVAAFQKTISLRPDWAEAHYNLGNVFLTRLGQPDKAEPHFRQAIALKPDFTFAYDNLGEALRCLGRPKEAEAVIRQALALQPDLPEAYRRLNTVLVQQGPDRFEDAVKACQNALTLRPDWALPYGDLGDVLFRLGHFEDAMAALQKAIALNPNEPSNYPHLGSALAMLGKLPEAEAACRKAIALSPDLAIAHFTLGQTLLDQGHFTEALDSLKRAHELGTKSQPWHQPSARCIQLAERFIRLDDRLPAILRGEIKPSDAAECVDIAEVCRKRRKRFYAASARFYTQVFAERPQLAEVPENRVNAACAAAMAARGRGEDGAALDEQERSRLRRQALAWLREALAYLKTTQDLSRVVVHRELRGWQVNPDLAELRDAAALAKLPKAEREACHQFWDEVAALLEKAGEPREPGS